jgi:hypothetical protein
MIKIEEKDGKISISMSGNVRTNAMKLASITEEIVKNEEDYAQGFLYGLAEAVGVEKIQELIKRYEDVKSLKEDFKDIKKEPSKLEDLLNKIKNILCDDDEEDAEEEVEEEKGE